MQTTSPNGAQESSYYHEYFSRGNSFNAVSLFYHSRILRYLQNSLPQVRGLTEIGVGFGYIAHLCAGKKLEYNGVEANLEQALRLNALGFKVDGASLETLRPDFTMHECVLLSHVLEHMDGFKAASEFLRQIHGRQRTGDHICVVCPDYLDMDGYFWDGDWSHGYPTTLRRTSQILRESGYEILSAKHWIGPGWTNPLVVSSFKLLMRLFPMRALDWFVHNICGKTPVGFRFMSAYGWRQLIVLARKVN
jgi:hypothetical protein